MRSASSTRRRAGVTTDSARGPRTRKVASASTGPSVTSPSVPIERHLRVRRICAIRSIRVGAAKPRPAPEGPPPVPPDVVSAG
jgi:hypothetical protein